MIFKDFTKTPYLYPVLFFFFYKINIYIIDLQHLQQLLGKIAQSWVKFHILRFDRLSYFEWSCGRGVGEVAL
jgi:hypothetical protein